MTAATVYRVIMNILLPIFTENQDIFTLLTFFHEELINHLLCKMLIKEKTKRTRKAPEHIINTSTLAIYLLILQYMFDRQNYFLRFGLLTTLKTGRAQTQMYSHICHKTDILKVEGQRWTTTKTKTAFNVVND